MKDMEGRNRKGSPKNEWFFMRAAPHTVVCARLLTIPPATMYQPASAVVCSFSLPSLAECVEEGEGEGRNDCTIRCFPLFPRITTATATAAATLSPFLWHGWFFGGRKYLEIALVLPV